MLWCGLGTRCWVCFICVFVGLDLVDADLGWVFGQSGVLLVGSLIAAFLWIGLFDWSVWLMCCAVWFVGACFRCCGFGGYATWF